MNKEKESSRPAPVAPSPRGADPVVRILFWLLVLVAVGVVLEFKGPYAGWFARLLEKNAPAKASVKQTVEKKQVPVKPPAKDIPPAVVGADGTIRDVNGDKTAPPKTEMELLYEKLWHKYLKKMPRPRIGRPCVIRLKDRSVVKGKLAAISPGKIVVRLKFGKMTYPVHLIAKSSYKKLFPEKIAKMKALKELAAIMRRKKQQELAKNKGAEEVTPPKERVPGSRPISLSKKTPAPAAPDPRELVRASPSPKPTPGSGKTPPDLVPLVQEYGNWLLYQQRHMGGKLVTRLNADWQDGNLMVYLTMHTNYLNLDYDSRYSLAEALWKFWSFRCQGAGKVEDVRRAHTVLLDGSGRVIGGSSADSGDDIWVVRKLPRATARR